MNYDKKKVKAFESRGQMESDWGVLYPVENIILKAIRYCPCIFKIDLILEGYECPKFLDNKSFNFGSPKEK